MLPARPSPTAVGHCPPGSDPVPLRARGAARGWGRVWPSPSGMNGEISLSRNKSTFFFLKAFLSLKIPAGTKKPQEWGEIQLGPALSPPPCSPQPGVWANGGTHPIAHPKQHGPSGSSKPTRDGAFSPLLAPGQAPAGARVGDGRDGKGATARGTHPGTPRRDAAGPWRGPSAPARSCRKGAV